MDFSFDTTLKNRLLLKQFLNKHSLQELNTIPKGFINNIFWNIAHTVVVQQLLIYKQSGLQPLVQDALIAKYRRGTRPEKDVEQQDVEEIKDFLFETIEQTQNDYKSGKFNQYKSNTNHLGLTLDSVEEAIAFNNFHEGLHLGYIQSLRRAIK